MIHPTAIIDPDARIAEGVSIGPYCVIGAGVEIGPGCELKHHVSVQGPTRIGANNRLFPFCSIGDEPQDKKYRGEASRLDIGDGNTIREYVTINRGTDDGGGITRVGDRNWIMAYVHIAHDCQLGDDIIMANAATLAGHVLVEDFAILGGFTKVHQFCRIGAHAFAGMNSDINKDVAPYVTVAQDSRTTMAVPRGINSEGLKRRGFSPEQIRLVKQAYKLLFRSGLSLNEALAAIQRLEDDQAVLQRLVRFVETSQRSLLKPPTDASGTGGR